MAKGKAKNQHSAASENFSKQKIKTKTLEDDSVIEPNLKDVRGLFLRSLAFIYFMAFLSIYFQIEGLFGTNGITPIKAELKLSSRTPEECIKDKFTLLCYIPGIFNIDSQHSMELITLVGISLSALCAMCVHCCIMPILFILWALYLSIYQVGSVFLWFQWDSLLLETGVLAILAAPWFPTKRAIEAKPRDLMSMFMVKWLLFRLMFASGVVKLSSQCPTWWNLTALNYHFESQCLPTPLAYFIHQAPTWILQFLTVATFYVEIIIPFAFFTPFRKLRLFSFYLQVLFQVAIILTGNYTFFNFLTIVLCISLLDAEYLKPKTNVESTRFTMSSIVSRAITFTFIGTTIYLTVKYFGLKLNTSEMNISSKIMFTKGEFDGFLALAVPFALVVAFLNLASTIAQALVISIFDYKGFANKFRKFITTFLFGVLCVLLFGITIVPFTSLHKESVRAIWSPFRQAHAISSNFHVTSSYGLFRRMTGTENGRPEVILEYSDEAAGPWKGFHFLYKPGNTSAMPMFVAPHQPRLDWQMWFASLSTYHDNPWLISLTYRLLTGEPSVQKLMDNTRMPKTIPKYIKASLYHYTFTNFKKAPTTWWERKKDKDYMAPFTKDNPPLVEFIRKLGYLDDDVPSKPSETLTGLLDKIRYLLTVGQPEIVLWGSIIALLIIIFTSRYSYTT